MKHDSDRRLNVGFDDRHLPFERHQAAVGRTAVIRFLPRDVYVTFARQCSYPGYGRVARSVAGG
jgi:hypothetical protein